MSEDYPSDFEAPPYSVLDRRIEGLDKVTTVVIDSEVYFFSIPLAVAKAAEGLGDSC